MHHSKFKCWKLLLLSLNLLKNNVSPSEPSKQGVVSLDNAKYGKQDTSTNNADDKNEDVASGPDKINAKHHHHSGLAINSNYPPNHGDKNLAELQLKNSDADSSISPAPTLTSVSASNTSASVSDSSISSYASASINTDRQFKLSASDHASLFDAFTADIPSNGEAQDSAKLSVNKQNIETGLSDDKEDVSMPTIAEDKQAFWDGMNPDDWYPEL
ncbi:hypothetical protein ARMGADRAFT_1033545 [Armillaria gallica]|uniref:Uncharacterized protein n=1 Tax=Armillaria gallica TaxID=47427 RepID=A0A2H3DNB7_ARMGA|nr:hypothetical protein ARMGADRAFT_1033545 [Armillaria gallica]